MTAKPKIAIVGAGLMGHGIAEVFAVAGHDVAVHDTVPASLASLMERVAAILAGMGEDAAALTRSRPVGLRPRPLRPRAVPGSSSRPSR